MAGVAANNAASMVGEDTELEELAAAECVARMFGAELPLVRAPVDAIHPVFFVGDLVIRLELGEVPDEVAKRVDVCVRLREGGVPFVAPVAAPISLSGFEGAVATVWEYVAAEPPLDWTALGRATRLLHDYVGPAEPPASPMPPVERLAKAIDNHPNLEPAAVERFRSRLPRLEATLDRAGWNELPTAPSHGDLWTKNVIPRGDNEVLLCDPDFLGLRPRAVDLAFLYQESRGDHRWQQVVEGYGREAVPPTEQLDAGYCAANVNWTTYVLERRHDWVDYTNDLAFGEW